MSSDYILYTKLQRVLIGADIVARERLIDLLESGVDRPLSLLSAPAGYGKSTLASQWVGDSVYNHSWLSMDSDHNDFHLFLKYFIAAIKQNFPESGFHIETMLEADPLPPAKDLTACLLNDLHWLPERFIYVLDDLHRTSNPLVHEFLASLLEHPSPKMHLVVLTRKEPPLPIAAMRGLGQVTEIIGADLRFTSSEVVEFLNLMLGKSVEEKVAALLEDKTEGWPVGLRLVGLYLQGQDQHEALVRELSGSSKFISEYLFAEITSRLEPAMVSFMLHAALLDRFCGPLCAHVRHEVGPAELQNHADEFIGKLEENNMFVIPLDTEGIWFRFHHLFQDFLQAMVKRQYDAEQIVEMHKSAACWFEESGLTEEAIKHYLASGSTSEATRLVLKNRFKLLNDSQFERLSRWLGMLPETELENSPLLASTKALIGTDLGKNVDIHAFTMRARRVLENLPVEDESFPILEGEVLLLESVVDMVQDSIEESLVKARQAYKLLPENAGMARSMCLFAMVVCLHGKGETSQAVEVVRDALANPNYTSNILARICFCLCSVHYMNADLQSVMETAKQSLQIVQGMPLYHTQGYARCSLGIAHYIQNDLAAAQYELQKVIDFRHTANPTWATEAGFAMICVRLALGNDSQAEQSFMKIDSYCREGGHVRGADLCRAFEVEFLLRRGETLKALEKSREVNFDIRLPRYFFYIPQLTYCKCLIEKGTVAALDEASAMLSSMNERMTELRRSNVRIGVLILLAIVHDRKKADDLAGEFLLEAIKIAEPGKWVRIFIDESQRVESILLRLAPQLHESAFIKEIMSACDYKTAHMGADSERLISNHEQSLNNKLTKREMDFLPLLAEGLSNSDIADRLNISQLTVKTHLKNIFRKLEVKNRIEVLTKTRTIKLSRSN
nr:LuxR C-terminal-related transcriptional regulator [uncultured Pseudodesulfovibrio sp.]